MSVSVYSFIPLYAYKCSMLDIVGFERQKLIDITIVIITIIN